MRTKPLISPDRRKLLGSGGRKNQRLSSAFLWDLAHPASARAIPRANFSRRSDGDGAAPLQGKHPENAAPEGPDRSVAAKLPHLGSSKVAKHSPIRRIRLANRCCGGVIISASATMLMKSKEARFKIISNAREKQNK
jgi:hypothetical protein